MKRILALITVVAFCLTMFTTTGFALDKKKEAGKLCQKAIKIARVKPQEAMKLLDKAISYDPKNPEYYYRRGLVEPNLGIAFTYFDRAIVLNPDKYLELCYSGDNKSNLYYYNDFGAFRFSTRIWDLYETNNTKAIKEKLASYVGNPVDNASEIFTAATDDSFEIMRAKDVDKKAAVCVWVNLDRNNEIESGEDYAVAARKQCRGMDEVSNLSEITIGKLGKADSAYFDYGQMINDHNYLCRNYSMAYNYYVLNITLVAYDQASFDAALKDFVDTFEYY